MPSWEHNGKNYMADYLRVLDDSEFRAAEFERYGIRCAVLYQDSETARDLINEGWQIRTEDGGLYILVEKEAD